MKWRTGQASCSCRDFLPEEGQGSRKADQEGQTSDGWPLGISFRCSGYWLTAFDTSQIFYSCISHRSSEESFYGYFHYILWGNHQQYVTSAENSKKGNKYECYGVEYIADDGASYGTDPEASSVHLSFDLLHDPTFLSLFICTIVARRGSFCPQICADSSTPPHKR